MPGIAGSDPGHEGRRGTIQSCKYLLRQAGSHRATYSRALAYACSRPGTRQRKNSPSILRTRNARVRCEAAPSNGGSRDHRVRGPLHGAGQITPAPRTEPLRRRERPPVLRDWRHQSLWVAQRATQAVTCRRTTSSDEENFPVVMVVVISTGLRRVGVEREGFRVVHTQAARCIRLLSRRLREAIGSIRRVGGGLLGP